MTAVPGPPIDKVFVYVLTPRPSSRLLVFESHDEDGYEVPKGKVEPGESMIDAVRREVFEETGLEALHDIEALEVLTWRGERQHIFIARHAAAPVEAFDHRVTGCDEDAGRRYRFRWIPLAEVRSDTLVQGCGACLEALRRWVERGGKPSYDNPAQRSATGGSNASPKNS
jgi:8-oxo-dGTP pyrophosphatase MutT (NUDIX family)